MGRLFPPGSAGLVRLRPVGVADAWVVGGLILSNWGLARKNVSLRLEGFVMLAASFVRIFFVNLNAAGAPGEISPRFYTVVPIALAFLCLRQTH